MAVKKKSSKKEPLKYVTHNRDLFLELLKEVREEIRSINQSITKIETNVEINTKDLTEHKEGVVQNRLRIEKLEGCFIGLKGEEKGKNKILKMGAKIVALILGIGSILYNIFNFFRS